MTDHRDGPGRRLRRRWLAMAGGVGLVLVTATAVGAAGGLDLTPSSGAPGTAYAAEVACGEAPLVYRANTQGAPEQGTVAPYPADEVSEVSPSVWRVQATAGDFDAAWYATCGDASVGDARFDAESPRLWLGPRGRPFSNPSDPKTILEGTDCPAGTEASGTIAWDGDILTPFRATIDELGDWSVDLPTPEGSSVMVITASCGSVTYDRLQLTTTSTTPPPTTPSSVPATVPTTVPPATPATPRSGTATFTG